MLDAQMREPLFDFLEEFYGKIRIFEEKTTGDSRADVLGVIDGEIIGFEIKSDRDSYTRLKTQTADYDELCDVNYLVVGKSHRRWADRHIPPHWGIICVYEETEETGEAQSRADGAWSETGEAGEETGKTSAAETTAIRVEIDQIPAPNPRARIERQLELLWRPELSRLQEWNGLPKYSNKSKQFVREKIAAAVPGQTLKRQITDLLFERDYEELLAEIRTVQKERRGRVRRVRGRARRRRKC